MTKRCVDCGVQYVKSGEQIHEWWCHHEMLRKTRLETWEEGYWMGVADEHRPDGRPRRPNPHEYDEKMWIDND